MPCVKTGKKWGIGSGDPVYDSKEACEVAYRWYLSSKYGKDSLPMSGEFSFFKEDKKKMIVYGVAMEPGVVDSQGEWIDVEDIEDAAHGYLADYRETKLSHKDPLNAVIVESYIAPTDLIINDSPIKKGSWVAAMKIYDTKVWDAIERGEIVGFSIGGVKQFL